MGTGIGLVGAARAGVNVIMLDKFDKGLEKSRSFADAWAQKEVDKQRMSPEAKAEVLGRMRWANFDADEAKECIAGADFIVEAVNEDIAIKRDVFGSLSANASKDAILASNTSSISITKIAASVAQRPERVIGMHFMNPVPVMKGIEVIRGLATDEDTKRRTLALCVAMGKTPTFCDKDMPGFVVNRILMPYINEAFFVLQEGVAVAEEIDSGMKLGTNVPMGPLTLADFIGLDTCLSIMQVLHNEFGDSKYRPAPLLQQYVLMGWNGKKSGRGVFNYAK